MLELLSARLTAREDSRSVAMSRRRGHAERGISRPFHHNGPPNAPAQGCRASRRGVHPSPASCPHEGHTMQTDFDREVPLPAPPDEPLLPVPDDTGTHDLADLWLDLGGGD